MNLQIVLATSAVLFSLGLMAAMVRRNAIMVLVGIELMMGAADLNFIGFWRFGEHPEALTGVMFAMFSIAVAAAEAAVGLAIVILLFRQFKCVEVDEANQLKG